MVDVRQLNRAGWDSLVEKKNRWTVPVSGEDIAAARRGDWEIVLTPTKPVPRPWFPKIEGAEILCLASGGGQQGPILAAAGARVVVYDNSPKQLEQDRRVADRDGLELETVEGDMADLGAFPDQTFGLIVHPVSNCFVPDILPVWSEAARVLRNDGVLLSGFTNPLRYLFEDDLDHSSDLLCVTHTIPYSDLDQLTEERQAQYIADGEPFEFGHTLGDQIGGQLEVGLVLTGFYEDFYTPDEDALSRFIPSFAATRARKEHR